MFSVLYCHNHFLIISFIEISYYTYLFCVGGFHGNMQKSEDSLQMLVLSFHHAGPGIELRPTAQVIRLDCKHLCSWSQLSSPFHPFSSLAFLLLTLGVICDMLYVGLCWTALNLFLAYCWFDFLTMFPYSMFSVFYVAVSSAPSFPLYSFCSPFGVVAPYILMKT